jgi:RNA polymerase sigma-70 factor (ECF subfamily)
VESPPPTGAHAVDLRAEILDLYHQHSAFLLKYAESIVRNQEEVRDAVQEAYLRYFIERRYGRQIGNPRAWLCQVLRNYLLDRRKAMPEKREVATDRIELAADQNQDPEKLHQCREAAEGISAALTGRELLCLRLHASGWRYDEIADVMEVRMGTVGALLTRIHQKLRRTRHDWMARGLSEAVFSFLSDS